MNMEYLTAAEFARLAGVSVRTVYRQMSQSLSQYVTTVKGVKMIEKSALFDVYGIGDCQECQSGVTDHVTSQCQTVTQIDTYSADIKALYEGQLADLRAQISFMREELQKKDEQIEKLLQLSAADKRLILEMRPEQPEENVQPVQPDVTPEPEKHDENGNEDLEEQKQGRGILSRIFNLFQVKL